MDAINYNKVFSNLCHVKALSIDNKFDEIVQHLILSSLYKEPNNPVLQKAKNVVTKISDVYGVLLKEHVVQSNLDKLISLQKIEIYNKYIRISKCEAEKINQNIQQVEKLEAEIKNEWFIQLRNDVSDFSDEELYVLWDALQQYLCKVFEQHGIQALKLLSPVVSEENENGFNLISLIEGIKKNIVSPKIETVVLTKVINTFFQNADSKRGNYLAQLADASFTSYALTTDDETQRFLNAGYPSLDLLLDTNFIFGVLDLHTNLEDAAAKEILEESRKNRLPFRLLYHPETLEEFRRTFDTKAMQIRASKWTRDSSSIALRLEDISPIEKLYHEKNIIEELDPEIFLEKYNHVELILKDLGLGEYKNNVTNSLDEAADMEEDIKKYKEFYHGIYKRRPKSDSGFKHDIVVLRDVRKRNKIKTSFLKSQAFFVSSDFVLAKFERSYYKKKREINYVISPSVFLQLIRPFIKNDSDSNKRFIDTFSIPDLRAFDINYSETRRRTLQILNDYYHGVSIETKLKIIRDEVLLSKMEQSKADYELQVAIIENRVSIENQQLLEENESIIKEKESLNEELTQIKEENEKLKLEKRQDQWKKERDEFISKKLAEKRRQYKIYTKKTWKAILAVLVSAVIAPIGLKLNIRVFDSELCNLLLLILLYMVLAGILFWRVFIADKEGVKNGLFWILTMGRESKKVELLNKHIEKYTHEYEQKNPKPQ